jgi:hypothetical protein
MVNRIRALFQQRRLERELQEEIAAHLAHQEDEFRRQGMDAQAARAAALREFGGVAQTAEDYRERRGVPFLEAAFRAPRQAFRGLARQPGFTAAAVLSLALGIGANTAIFSMFQTLMLRMLPVANASELVYLFQTGAGDAGYASPSLYLDLAQRTDLFRGVLARRNPSTIRLQGSATARVENVSTNYFEVLGVQSAMGRFFAAGETGAAVLSYQYWQNRPDHRNCVVPDHRRGGAPVQGRRGRAPCRSVDPALHSSVGECALPLADGPPQTGRFSRGSPDRLEHANDELPAHSLRRPADCRYEAPHVGAANRSARWRHRDLLPAGSFRPASHRIVRAGADRPARHLRQHRAFAAGA